MGQMPPTVMTNKWKGNGQEFFPWERCVCLCVCVSPTKMFQEFSAQIPLEVEERERRPGVQYELDILGSLLAQGRKLGHRGLKTS